jgi:hypothetical protein
VLYYISSPLPPPVDKSTVLIDEQQYKISDNATTQRMNKKFVEIIIIIYNKLVHSFR